MRCFYHYHNAVLLLRLHIIPGSKTDQIVGLYGDSYIKIKIKARAINGKANAYLLSYLSHCFGVNKNAIQIKGEHNRNKTVYISHPTKIPKELKNYLPDGLVN